MYDDTLHEKEIKLENGKGRIIERRVRVREKGREGRKKEREGGRG